MYLDLPLPMRSGGPDCVPYLPLFEDRVISYQVNIGTGSSFSYFCLKLVAAPDIRVQMDKHCRIGTLSFLTGGDESETPFPLSIV